MAKTAGGALRNVVISSGVVDDRVALDFAEPDTPFPYITYNDTVAFTAALQGDGKTNYFAHDQQLNLWQLPNDEDPTLVGRLIDALDGTQVSIEGDSFTSKIKVQSVSRLDDNYEDRLIQHVITVSFSHSRTVF